MQEWCKDYYLNEYDTGCCLNCSKSHDGCLCFDCKCAKCYWYRPTEKNDGVKGKCDKVKTKEEWREHYESLEEKNNEEFRKRKKEQEKEEEKHIDYIKSITMKPNDWLDEQIKKEKGDGNKT